jgi:hypothetical protein
MKIFIFQGKMHALCELIDKLQAYDCEEKFFFDAEISEHRIKGLSKSMF